MSLGASPRGLLILALAALGLSACSPLPYPTSAPRALERDLKDRDARDARDPRKNAIRPFAVALCYSDTINTPRELMDEARLACGSGRLTYHGSDTFWTPCSVQQPARATFVCTPARGAGAAPPAPQ